MNINLNRLAAERRAKGLTQTEMAEKMGWKNRQSYSNRENGISPIQSQELFKMMKVLGYTIDDIKLFLKE